MAKQYRCQCHDASSSDGDQRLKILDLAALELNAFVISKVDGGTAFLVAPTTVTYVA
jgi:hypothetical protein